MIASYQRCLMMFDRMSLAFIDARKVNIRKDPVTTGEEKIDWCVDFALETLQFGWKSDYRKYRDMPWTFHTKFGDVMGEVRF